MKEDKQEQPTQEEERIQELEEQLARVSADYANYRRRTEQQAEQTRKRAAQQLVSDILAVVDNLELAINQADKDDGLYKGVELVLGQLITVLESHEVQKIDTDGQFDPEKHEALLSQHSEQEEGEIIEVLQQGYQLAGNTLRTAKVKVSKGPENTQNE